MGTLFEGLGLSGDELEAAVAAYRRFYAEDGIHRSSVYPGVEDLLDALVERGIVLATATAKLTPVARAILDLHGLADRFAVVNGTDPDHSTKTETLTHTLELLAGPPPAGVLMVGDRHSDMTAARACGVGSVGVCWGYGTTHELQEAGADHLVRAPAEVLALLP